MAEPILTPSREELDFLIASEGSARAAARKLGVHHKTVARWLKGDAGTAKVEAPADASPLLMFTQAQALHERADALMTSAVKAALECVDGNVRRAADILQMPHRTLDSMLRTGRMSHLKSLTRSTPGRPKAQ